MLYSRSKIMVPTFWSQSRTLFRGSERRNLYKGTDINRTLIKIQEMCHFFMLARVKCKCFLGSNAPSSQLSGSLAQLIFQASRIFLWCQTLLVLRIVAFIPCDIVLGCLLKKAHQSEGVGSHKQPRTPSIYALGAFSHPFLPFSHSLLFLPLSTYLRSLSKNYSHY